MAEWLLIIVRTLTAFVVLFVVARLLAKKQVSQFTFFDYVVGITMGSLAAFIAFGAQGTGWYLGLIALMTFTLLVLLTRFLSMKSKKIRDWIVGKSTVLIKDGKIMEDNMKKTMMTSDELLQQLRLKQAFSVADVEFALLETTGDLSVMLKKENMPLTPKMLGITMPKEHEPQTVMMDGKILDEPLATIGLSRGWLNSELEKAGVTVDNVYIGQVNSYGELTIDCYDDQLQLPEPQPRALMLATLKKCAADIELFSLATVNEQAKQMYEQCVHKLNKLIADLRPYCQ